VVLAQTRWWVGDFDRSLSLISETIESVRGQGPSAVMPLALAVRSEVSVRTGRWESAYADAMESVRWATELHQPGVLGYALSTAARIEAARGERGLCEERIERCRRGRGPSVAGSLALYEEAVVGLAALAAGEPEEAVEHLSIAWRQAVEQGLGHPDVVPFAGDLIEAHVRSGHPEQGSEVLAWLDDLVRTSGMPGAAAIAERGRALMTEAAAESLALFASALTEHDRWPMPFERARTLLCQGEVQRRARRGVDARASLREAVRIFEGLGARPWADRARAELAASSGRATRVPGGHLGGVEALTPQELQIARAVASGKSNGEAAAALFVSRKTVEAHLTQIYRKLGIGSRTELTRTMVVHGIAE
jgi:DNA-binding CsgD family transcriptional regulator